MILLEFDLAGADWIVAAYAAGEPRMIEVAESGESPHPITGSLISGAPRDLVIAEHKAVGSLTDPDAISEARHNVSGLLEGDFFLPRSMSIRQAGKKSNHGLNYDMQYKRFALENEIAETDAKRIVYAYLNDAYPGIPNWHAEIRDQLSRDRTLINPFGRKVRLLEAWGADLFKAAYSFVPQSTVFDVTRRAMILAYWDDQFPQSQLLGQVHDSLLYQFPAADLRAAALFCQSICLEHMKPAIILRGRRFWLNVDAKVGYKWGSGMNEFAVTDDLDETIENLRRGLEPIEESPSHKSDQLESQRFDGPSAAPAVPSEQPSEAD